MAVVPADLAEYLKWAQGDKGPGTVFATTFLRELRNVEEKPAPALPLDAGAEAMVWRELGKIKAFSVAKLDASDTAFTQDTAEWWRSTGANLVAELVEAKRRMVGSAGAWTKKEAEHKILNQASCCRVYTSAFWNGLMTDVYGGDLVQAIAKLAVDLPEAGMVIQAVVNVTEMYGVKLKEGDVERLAVYNGVKELDGLIETAVEGE